MNYVHATSHTPQATGQPAVNVVVRPWRDHSSENIVYEDCLVAPLYEDLNGYRNEVQAYNDAWRVAKGEPDGIVATFPLTVSGTKQMVVHVLTTKGYLARSERLVKISKQAHTARSGILIPSQLGKMVIGRYAYDVVAAAVAFRRATGRECHAVVCTDMGKDYRKWYFLGISVSTLDCMNALKEAKQGGYEPMHFRLGTPQQNLMEGGTQLLSFGSGGFFEATWLDTSDMGLAFEISVVIIGFDFDFFGHASEADALKFLQAVLGPVGLRGRPYRPPGYDDTTKLTVFCPYEHAETLKETLRECTEKAKEGRPLLYGTTKTAICDTVSLGDVYLSVFKKTPRAH